ncbi:NUDIX hydrolase [Nonomuraea jiangxiensis]|uniref:ADP-ribose pyrophosphatase YjhB, NUDIX family n=1 Tax=Nonomuraea jiangxiensis TaxID=633440 RepID=A0A1G8LKI8_9ACTN|nr:NUDIX domain-containing protein [Nonomuraea jiangxiensis]SDI56125.1 ADP-ribose pyrophosphatase YjhB, NUDIX family [Nonomuraea jiangxiensis]
MPIPRAVAVVIDGNRVLVIKRFLRRGPGVACVMCDAAGWQGSACPGHHYALLPGGHVEDGESPESAAVRELHEETTLTGKIDRLLFTGSHSGRPAFYFLIRAVSGVPSLSGEEAVEHGPDNSFELKWATAAEFEQLNLYPRDARGPLTELLHS